MRTLEILNEEYPERIARVYSYRSRIRESLRAAGYQTADGAAPINSIEAGTSEDTLMLAKALFERGLLSTPFVYPSVPKTKGRVRLIAGANLSEKTIDTACRIFAEVKHEVMNEPVIA